MMKNLMNRAGALMLFLLLGASLSLNANPVDSTFAKQMAGLFYRQLSPAAAQSRAVPSVVYRATRTVDETGSEVTDFYIVNFGDEGYVMMAGDDRMVPVLAYSTTSSFHAGIMPPNMASLLRDYQRQIKALLETVEQPAPEVVAAWEAVRHPSRNLTRNVVVAPLITSRWNQLPIYNALCPADPRSTNGHASAGCTAVAMGQILRYWAYPSQGVGSHSYVCNNSYMGPEYGDYGTLSANFAATNYDYANMPDSLTSASSAAEVNAVATLLYHCGISINTAYGVYNSSAAVAEVDDAFRNYFGFPDARHIYRSVFSEANWLRMIKNELNHWRPVFYSGAGAGNAHAFVCDGYDDQNFFHINWGWGGYADGYFLLSNLSPDVYHYNTVQTAIINVMINPATMTLSEEELTFFQEEETPAAIQRVDVQTDNVQLNIQLSVAGNFSLSADSVNFSSQLTLPAAGGSFFVKYTAPAGQLQPDCEHSKVVLDAGPVSDTLRLVGLHYVPVCHAPQAFTAQLAVTDTNDVQLSWQAPVPELIQFSWDSVQRDVMGGLYDYSAYYMHRMEEADLLPLHGHLFTHVSFIPMPQATQYRIVVYQGGGLSDNGLYGGTLVVDKNLNLNDLVMGQWNSIALDAPITLDASQELWYGVYVSAPAGINTIVYGNSPCVPYKGNVFGYVTPYGLFWSPFSSNFVLKATIDNAFVEYELYRDGSLLMESATATSYTDYLPARALYLYEVSAVWNNQCGGVASQLVDWAVDCEVVNTAETAQTCDSAYLWNGTLYTESGTYHHVYNDPRGCVHNDTLYLTVNHSSLTVDTVVTCMPSYTWINGQTYTESTDAPYIIYQNAEGCDSVVRLCLIMLQATTLTDTIVACDSYTWRNGVTYNESIYGPTVHYTDVIGCDNATVTLFLTINYSSLRVDSVTACDSYTWIDGQTYTTSTSEPTLTYTASNGCDSVVQLHLTLYHSAFQVDEQESCGPFTWIDGITYTASTSTPTVTLTGPNGCDSVVQLHLTVGSPATGIDERTACDAFTWIDGQIYTESTSTPTVTLVGTGGCDSVVTLHLTLHHSSSAVDSVYSVGPYTWIDGVTYTHSIEGPTAILTNAEGCDSVVVLYLTVEVGVESHASMAQLTFYPNPTSGLLYVELTNSNAENLDNVQLHLFDIYGKLLNVVNLGRVDAMNRVQLDLSAYANGVYFLKAVSNTTLLSIRKVVKNR